MRGLRRYAVLLLVPAGLPWQPANAADVVRATIVIERQVGDLVPRITAPGQNSFPPSGWHCENELGTNHVVVRCTPPGSPGSYVCAQLSVQAGTPASARGLFAASYCGTQLGVICGARTTCTATKLETRPVPFSCALYYPEFLASVGWRTICRTGPADN